MNRDVGRKGSKDGARSERIGGRPPHSLQRIPPCMLDVWRKVKRAVSYFWGNDRTLFIFFMHNFSERRTTLKIDCSG